MSKEPDLQTLKMSIQDSLGKYSQKMVIGDFNFDCQENNTLTRYFKSIDLHQIVQEPTHEEGRTIDHIYATQQLKSRISVTNVFKYFTDHSAFQIKLLK